MITLNDVPDDLLVDRLLQIRKQERSLLVELLRCLAELDRRKAVLALGFPSLFAFCTEHLGLTKASAFRRTTAARLLARFPLVAEYLADGRLNLTTLVELRDILDEAHLIDILDRAARSRHQLELHHLDPFVMGGAATAANLALRCHAHNLHAAEQDFGRDRIERKIAAGRACKNPPAAETLPGLSS
jgi:hypothetical protein